MIEARRTFLVPPADAEHDGELSVLGMRQSRALGDALGDVPLRAVYAGPGLAAEDTAATVAHRHGLVVRRRPTLRVGANEPFDVAMSRVLETFENITRVGPGRTSLIVVDLATARIMLSHCSGVAPSPEDGLSLPPASITEVTIEPARFVVERLGDEAHLTAANRPLQR